MDAGRGMQGGLVVHDVALKELRPRRHRLLLAAAVAVREECFGRGGIPGQIKTANG